MYSKPTTEGEKQMAKLDNKVAVVTGGNSGIGLATAKTLIEEGARVAIFGRNRKSLDEAKAALGDKAIAVQGDVSRLEDLDRLYTTVREQLGKVDVLFVNAGLGRTLSLADTTEEDFDLMFDVNVKGAFFTVKKALGSLNDGASVIFNTSVANRVGIPGMSAYSATKAAVRSLARSFSAELVARGIRVNAVSPGPIETPIFDKMGLPAAAVQEFADSVIQQVPLKRFGAPEEIANAVKFLATSDSSYVVGAEIVVDGGMTQV